MREYGEFRIRIERGPEEGTYRVECSGLGGDGAGGFTLPFTDTELENFVLKVGRTRRGVRKIESPEMQLARKFGGQLFSAVMQGKTGELYRAASSEARATGQGLRITLSLTDVPELGGIPWEYLYDEPNFLSINAWTPVVRYLDLPKPRRALEMELPLRILGVISNPLDAEPLDVELEKAKLENALKPLRDANAVAIDWLEEPTLLALAKKLRPDTYHILHFIGHGGFDDVNGEGALLFEDAAGRGRAVSGDQLAAVLYEKRSLRLVLLNSCEGARNAIKDPFSGVAASLVQREIPAVIGMQFEITDRAAVLFASEFYAMLAEGQPIDSAISEARLAIWADSNDVEWGTPVLFMRVADGRLFNVSHAAALPRPAPEALPSKVAPVVDEAPPVIDKAPPVVDVPPPPVDVPPPVVTRAPPPVVEPPSPVAEPPPPVIEQPPPPVVAPPPVTGAPPPRLIDQPSPVVGWPPAPKETTVTTPTPRPRRRVPWGKVAIGGIAVVAVLTAIGLLLPNMTGSIQVSSAGPGTGIVLVSGIGFVPGEAVDLSIDGIPAGFAIANSDGSISAQLTVGTQASGRVDALGRLSGNQASSDYAVIIAGESIAPTATPEPNESGGEIASAQPDSPGILFYSDVEPDTDVAGDKEIYLWDPLSGKIAQLTFNDVDDTFPAWSPDHTQIAFSRQLGKTPEGDIFIRDLAGTYEAPLTSGPADDWYPAWSKNNEIAFARRTPPNNESAIVVVRPDVAGERVVVSGTEVRAPSWSPDGTTLAFMSRMFAPDLDVSIVRADGTGSIERLTSGTSDDRTPTWSPDGLTLAFTMNIGAREGDELYLLDVGTKIAQPLTDNDVQDGNPVWSPDGSQIAFFRKSSTGYHIWTTDANGTERDLMPERLGDNIDPNWR